MRRRIAIITAGAVMASTMLVAPVAEARVNCKNADNVPRCCAKKTDTTQREAKCIERNSTSPGT